MYTPTHQADLAYGSKLNRIRGEAENILHYERDLVEIAGGLPSLAAIDAARIRLQVGGRAILKGLSHEMEGGYKSGKSRKFSLNPNKLRGNKSHFVEEQVSQLRNI